jgi:hypothetical protein
MTRPPYLNHGREHKPGGSDPIPGLGGGLLWAYIDSNESSHSCAAATSTRIAADSSTFYTNAPAVFDAHNSPGGVMGVRILADGHYLFWMTGNMSTAPVAGDKYDLVAEGGGAFADFGWQPSLIPFVTGGIAPGAVFTGGVMSVGGFLAAPTDAIVARFDNNNGGGGNTLHFVYTGLVIIQLDAVNQDL